MSFSHGDWSCFNLQWRAVPPHTRWQFWRKRMTVSTSDLWEMRLLHWLVATLSSPFPRIGRNLACCLSADRFCLWVDYYLGASCSRKLSFFKRERSWCNSWWFSLQAKIRQREGIQTDSDFQTVRAVTVRFALRWSDWELVPPFPTDIAS